jgi:glycosyltransferase involved in cell wall biosynthesis
MSPYYLPGYKAGGALRSIVALVDHLKNDFHFKIFTTDRDLLDDISYPTVVIDKWIEVGRSEVFYASAKSRTPMALLRIIKDTPHDILYLNSFFNPTFTLIPLVANRLGLLTGLPIIIAPRGEFSRGALNIKSWKKRPFIFITKVLGLYREIIWQASSQFEAEDISRVMNSTQFRIDNSSKVIIAPDLTIIPFNDMPLNNSMIRLPGAQIRICFISRIAPVKNLDFALKILGRIKIPLIFDIYGPIEDADYWETCQEIINGLTDPVTVNYKGSIEYNDVSETFAKYDLFFFPTHGENYGHVIIESMLAGTPVLLSDTTPWRNLEERGVGWDLPLENAQAFSDAINAIATDLHDQEQRRRRVSAYALSVLSDPAIIESNKLLFELAHKSADKS